MASKNNSQHIFEVVLVTSRQKLGLDGLYNGSIKIAELGLEDKYFKRVNDEMPQGFLGDELVE